MPKSKKRGGAKAHKKRVNNRNHKIDQVKKKYTRERTEMFEQMMKDHEKQIDSQEQGMPDIDQIEGIDGPEI